MRYFILTILFCCCTIVVTAQNARVFFISDKDVDVIFYRTMDNGYNNKAISMEMSLKSGKIETMIFGGFQNWEMIHCAFSNGQDCELLLFPHDDITVYVSSQGIRFEGNNATGLQFFYDEFTSVGHRLKYLNTIDAYFEEYINHQRSIRSITPIINESIINPQLAKLQHLQQEKTIKDIFYEKLSKNIEMLLNGYIAERMTTLLKNQRYRIIAAKDSAIIMYITDSIYQKHPITDYDLIKFNYCTLYIPQYLYFYYGNQPIEALGYDMKAFGPYGVYLQAPHPIQAALLGSACMTELKYKSKEIDLPTLKRFFNERFPQSPYIFILNSQVKEDENVDGKRVEGDIIYIGGQPKTMVELAHIPEYIGKYLFVDLWATWCMPCRAELSHSKEVYQLLEQYPNVIPLYISIDKEKQETAWKKLVDHYQLTGYHLRASSALEEDIKLRIYGPDAYEIPRYALIAPDGTILHRNLPRPSELALLKDELDKLLKNSSKND